MTAVAQTIQRSAIQKTGLMLAPILFILPLLFQIDPAKPEISRMVAVAALMAVLWITEAIPHLGIFTVPGWGQLMPFPKLIDDGTVAICMALILFFLPSKSEEAESATLSASCAFMMPIATPPNAIVFGSGRIKMIDMVKAGLLINFIGVAVITAVFFLIGISVFSIDPGALPAWAVLVAN